MTIRGADVSNGCGFPAVLGGQYEFTLCRQGSCIVAVV